MITASASVAVRSVLDNEWAHRPTLKKCSAVPCSQCAAPQADGAMRSRRAQCGTARGGGETLQAVIGGEEGGGGQSSRRGRARSGRRPHCWSCGPRCSKRRWEGGHRSGLRTDFEKCARAGRRRVARQNACKNHDGRRGPCARRLAPKSRAARRPHAELIGRRQSRKPWRSRRPDAEQPRRSRQRKPHGPDARGRSRQRKPHGPDARGRSRRGSPAGRSLG